MRRIISEADDGVAKAALYTARLFGLETAIDNSTVAATLEFTILENFRDLHYPSDRWMGVDIIHMSGKEFDCCDAVMDTQHPHNIADWIAANDIETLRVTGPSKDHFWTPTGEAFSTFDFTFSYLSWVFRKLGLQKLENGV